MKMAYFFQTRIAVVLLKFKNIFKLVKVDWGLIKEHVLENSKCEMSLRR